MAIDLEQLNIVITGEAMDAIATLDILVDRLKELKAAASGFSAKTISTAIRGVGSAAKTASGNINDLNGSLEGTTSEEGRVVDGTTTAQNTLRSFSGAVGSVIRGVADFRQTMKETIPSINLNNTALARLLRTFKRVATMRLMRWAIRQLTTAAKEGLEILIEWDRTFGNNTSYAAKTVDELSAKWREVKKSVGAALMPLIQIAQPAIEAVLNGVIQLANAFNQVLRSIQGFGTYMKATYINTKATTEAAKELRRVLFGFDELNVLNGNGGTGATLSVSPIEFSTEEIESKWKVLADKIKKIWENLKTALKPVIDSIKKMFGGLGDTIYGLLTGDFSLAWEGIKKTFSGLIDFMVGAFKGMLDFFRELLTPAYMWVYDNVIKPIKENIDGLMKAVKSGVILLMIGIEKYILENHPVLAKILGISEESLKELKIKLNVITKNDANTTELEKLHETVNAGANLTIKVATKTTLDNNFKKVAGLASTIHTIAFDTGIDVGHYASGGDPDMGTLFWAGENGGAEVVATSPSGTGVMNMKQMQEAVSNGNVQVVNALGAMTNAVVSAINSKDTNAYLDGQKITETVLRRANGMARATGQPVMVR